MRKNNLLAFDETIVGTNPVYTKPELNETFGSVDKYSIQCVGDQVSGTSPTVKVQAQHCADGINFKEKNATAEIVATTLVPTVTNNFIGSDAGSTPSLGFVRFQITLGGTTPQAHIKLWFTGRDDG